MRISRVIKGVWNVVEVEGDKVGKVEASGGESWGETMVVWVCSGEGGNGGKGVGLTWVKLVF